MKRPALANDKTSSLYSGRSYLSASPKSALASYYKSANFTLNSPKNDPSKGFIYSPKQQNTSIRSSSQMDKSDMELDRKPSRRDNDAYDKYPPSNNNIYGIVNKPPARIRGSSNKSSYQEKNKLDVNEYLGLNSKLYGGSKIADSAGIKSAKRNMEISTDLQTYKQSGALKAYSTRNKDQREYEHKSMLAGGKYATNTTLEYASKYMQMNNQSTNNAYGVKYENLKTDPNEEKGSQSPSKKTLNKILANTSEKGFSSSTTRKTPLNEERVYTSQSSLKVNNFFSNNRAKEADNSMKKEKSVHMSQKFDYGTDDMNHKKSSNLDNRYVYKSGYNNTDEQNYEYNNGLTQNPTSSPKASGLGSFITKVEKGSAFPIKPPSRKEEDSHERQQPKSLQPLDDRNKSLKSVPESNRNSNNPKQTITFSKGRMNQQALATSSQETTVRTKKPSGSSTPLADSIENLEATTPVQTKKTPIVYYIAGMNKYHKNKKESDYFAQIYREHLIQSFQALSFCKYLKQPDPKLLQNKKVMLPKRSGYKDKKTIIFDLDETLVHCNESTDIPSDVILPIRFPHGEIIDAGINIRPYAVEILKALADYFEVIIFTASHSCYANVVLDYLDPKGQYIHHRLYRESCVITEEGVYVKDLRVFGNRNMADMVLVDNASYSFGFQIENGIPIVPYYDNKQDDELKHLTDYLLTMVGAKDMREVNKQTFKLHTYSKYDTVEKVINNIILKSGAPQ